MSTNSAPFDRAELIELVRRFDRPGPRYTSYPTAVEFGDEVGPELYRKHLRSANERAEAPLSLYVHLPFCEERCLFCGCNVIVNPERRRVSSYLSLLERELELVAAELPDRRGVCQLHLGGGTPTYHPPAELDALLTKIEGLFTFRPGAERAIEVDPRVTSLAHLDVLAEHGFDRISLGVQDLDPNVQQAIGRVQSRTQIDDLIQAAKARGFRSVNVDLIYGLPCQTVASFERTVDAMADLGADRAAVYSFAYIPWIKGHQKQMPPEALPDAETKVELFCVARERFLAAGFEPIGMDHFARPTDELVVARAEGRLARNFQGYTVLPTDDVIAFGISGIGEVDGLYVQNERKLSRYTEALEAERLPSERGVSCTAEDRLRSAVIHELMCNFRVDRGLIEKRFGIDFESHFRVELGRLEEHVRDGLVHVEDDAIQATPRGELFVRNLAMCFDAYRDPAKPAPERVFSRTV